MYININDPIYSMRYQFSQQENLLILAGGNHRLGEKDNEEESYEELEKLKKLEGLFIRHFTVVISEKENNSNYIEISTARVPYDADNLQATVDLIRDTAFKNKDVTVEFDYKTLLFVSGQQFKNWIEMNKYDITEIQKKGKIKQ